MMQSSVHEDSFSRGRRAFLRQQVVISVAINALIPTAIIRIIGVPPPLTLLGERGILPALILASGLATTLMTLGLSMVVRANSRKGIFGALPRESARGFSARLPTNLLARALCMGVLAVTTLVPCGVAALVVLDLLPLGPRGFIVWNLLYGAAVGASMAPWVVHRAMLDPVVRRSSTS